MPKNISTKYNVDMSTLTVGELAVLILIVVVLLMMLLAQNETLSPLVSALILAAVLMVTYQLVQYKAKQPQQQVAAPSKEGFQVAATNVTYKDLMVYFTSLSPQSFPGSGLRVLNIANTVPERNVFQLSQQVVWSGRRDEGLNLSGTYMTGPLSSDLGIYGTLPYSIVWYARNRDIAGNEVTRTANIFYLYGNTSDNTGTVFVSVDLVKGETDQRIKVTHGTNTPGVFIKGANTHVVFEADPKFHLYALVKDETSIKLYVDAKETPLVSMTITNNDLQFSNKEMVINKGGLWRGDILSFAAYNRALSLADRNTFLDHVNTGLVKQSALWQASSSRLAQLEAQNASRSNCPFQQNSVCVATCSNVADWSSYSNIMSTASDTCLRDIFAYCDSTSGNSDVSCQAWRRDRLSRVMGCSMSNAPPALTINPDSTRLKTVLEDAVLHAKESTQKDLPLRIVGSSLSQTGPVNSVMTKEDVVQIIKELNLSVPSLGLVASSNASSSNAAVAKTTTTTAATASTTTTPITVAATATTTAPKNIDPATGMVISTVDEQNYDAIIGRYRNDIINQRKQNGTGGGFFSFINNLIGL